VRERERDREREEGRRKEEREKERKKERERERERECYKIWIVHKNELKKLRLRFARLYFSYKI